MERIIKTLLEPFLLDRCSFGRNQFAYTPERGARDVLALLVAKWILALSKGKKILLYAADVAGAFDRVLRERLMDKLRARGVHPPN